MKTLLTTVAAVAVVSLFSCGKPAAKPPTASSAKSSTSAGAQALKGKKPADAMKTTQAPKPAPAAKSAGSTTVKPKDLTKGGTVEVETWAFADVDLDGDGAGESGVVAVAGDDVAAWWTGAFLVEEQNTTVPYEAMLWTENGGVGFIFDFGQAAIACGVDAGGTSACISCDAQGMCSVATGQ